MGRFDEAIWADQFHRGSAEWGIPAFGANAK